MAALGIAPLLDASDTMEYAPSSMVEPPPAPPAAAISYLDADVASSAAAGAAVVVAAAADEPASITLANNAIVQLAQPLVPVVPPPPAGALVPAEAGIVQPIVTAVASSSTALALPSEAKLGLHGGRKRKSEGGVPYVPMTAEQAVATAAAEGITLERATNSGGYAGVQHQQRCKTNPYAASIWRGGRRDHLGCFATAEEAGLVAARAKKAVELSEPHMMDAAEAERLAEEEGLTLEVASTTGGYVGVLHRQVSARAQRARGRARQAPRRRAAHPARFRARVPTSRRASDLAAGPCARERRLASPPGSKLTLTLTP